MANGHDADERNARLRRRMLMARIEAGYGEKISDLADRLRELGYVDGWSKETLGAMERGRDSRLAARAIRPEEILVLAEACGVSPSFFDADFSRPIAAGEDALRDEISDLRQRLGALATDVARHSLKLEAIHDTDHRTESAEDDPR
jgi:hypothetical protein